MRIDKRLLALGMTAVLAVAACGNATTSTAPSSAPSTAPSEAASEAPSTEPSAAPSESAAAVVLEPDAAEAVIPGVEDSATVKLWTFWLSPTFDDYIKATIDRFEATYPGVTVEWEDHQATFQEDLENSFNAGNAPDVINLSVSEGWVSDYASRDLLLGLNDKVPQPVQDIYFDGLWDSQLVEGQNYQFPWYQGMNVELINKRIYEEGAGLSVADFPKTVEELPAVCATIKEKTGSLCTIRLTVNDLLAQMTYEGGVKVINDAGDAFTFDSPEAVAWLQLYVDMVKAGTVDNTALTTQDDRVGLLIFSAGQSPFYATGPNLIREVKANNETLYNDLAVAPSPVGKSGVLGKGLMAMSVKADTAFPNASMALAQYFTNPRAMVEFAKQVAVYPSSDAAYDDPFFSETPEAIEDSARPVARETISKYADIVPTVPNKADVNEIVRKKIEEALFADKPAQQALSEAVQEANALID